MGFASAALDDESGEDEGTGPTTIGSRTDAGMGGMEGGPCGGADVDGCSGLGCELVLGGCIGGGSENVPDAAAG